MTQKIKLLVVDDEVRFLSALTKRLSLRDFDVTSATSGDRALELAEEGDFDLALVDLKMPGMSGEQVLDELKQRHPLIEVVILTGHGSIDSAVNCTQAGSYSYLQKPCETEELLEVLKNAYKRRLERKLAHDRERLAELSRIAVGGSPLSILKKLKELDRQGGKARRSRE